MNSPSNKVEFILGKLVFAQDILNPARIKNIDKTSHKNIIKLDSLQYINETAVLNKNDICSYRYNKLT